MHIGRGDAPDYPFETPGTWETALEDAIRERAESHVLAEQPRNVAPSRAAPTPSASTMPRPSDPAPGRRLNVILRMWFVDPDSTVIPYPTTVSIIEERGDATEVHTSALGAATFTLPAGRSRAVSTKRADFDGRRYEWDGALTVRTRMALWISRSGTWASSASM